FDGGFDIANSGDTLTVGQMISGDGSLTKRGAGRLVLSSDSNSYAGGTRLEGGSLQLSSLNNLGGPNATITFAGGVLRTTGAAITSLAANDVNWTTFDGGFDIATSGATLSLTQPIS